MIVKGEKAVEGKTEKKQTLKLMKYLYKHNFKYETKPIK